MAKLNSQEIKNRLSITQLLAYYKAKPANPNGLYFCINCKNPKPSLLATDANGRAKCDVAHCKIKGADIFDLIMHMEKCTFNQAVIKAESIALNLSQGWQASLLLPESSESEEKKRASDKNAIIPKLTELKKSHRVWFNEHLKVDADWMTFYFKARGWYRHHIAIPIDSNQESYVFIPLDKTKDQIFYRGRVRTSQIFPNNSLLWEESKHIIVCHGEAEVLKVSWELYRRKLLGEWAAVTLTVNPFYFNKDTLFFSLFKRDRVKSVTIAFPQNLDGWEATIKWMNIAKEYFLPATLIDSFTYPSSHPEITTLSEYVDHPLLIKEAPFENLSEEKVPEKLIKKNQNVINRLASASADIVMNEPVKADFLHTVLCQVGMPRKKTDGRLFERRNGGASILLEAGRLWNGREWEEHPLPYGALPRLIMIYISGQAVLTKKPVIEIGNSLTEFMQRLGVANSGGEKGRYNSFKKQLYSLAASRLSLGMTIDNHSVTVDTKPIHKFLAWMDHSEEPRLWSGYIELSADFFNHLQEYSVPLDSRALASLKHSALALDIYTWLANRLPRIKNPEGIFLSWDNLYEQFGQEYKQPKDFIDEFQKKMLEVKLVYMNANIEEVRDNRGYLRGYRFKHSRPPISSNLLLK